MNNCILILDVICIALATCAIRCLSITLIIRAISHYGRLPPEQLETFKLYSGRRRYLFKQCLKLD